MLLDVIFNGYSLAEYCTIRSVLPRTKDLNGGLTLDIEVTIKDQVMKNLDLLNKILHTREPVPLIVSDYPDRELYCELASPVELNSRFYGADATLSFYSEDGYWHQIYENDELPEFESDVFNTVTVNNRGTAPTVPYFWLDMPSETGFLGIVAPNGYISLGNHEDVDQVNLPKSERVMAEDMHLAAMSDDPVDWRQEGQISSLIPDGGGDKPFTSAESAKHDKWGILVSKAERPIAGSDWNGWAYRRKLDPTTGSYVAPNFSLNSRMNMYDRSGSNRNTACIMYMVLDDNARPIMSTSIYNASQSTNEVTVMLKLLDTSKKMSGVNPSKVVKTFKFPSGLANNATIYMNKTGDRFTWKIDTKYTQGKTKQTSKTVKKTFKIGNTVYIANGTRHYWHSNGTKVWIPGFVRGRAHKVTNIRNFRGKKQYLISYRGAAVAWVDEGNLSGTMNGSGTRTIKQMQSAKSNGVESFAFTASELGSLKPSEVMIYGGTKGDTEAFTSAGIAGITMDVYNHNHRVHDLHNIFQPGDHIMIDNETGEIYHNGHFFQGHVDYDTRFFDIDPGESEIKLVTSEWTKQQPILNVGFGERFY